MSRATLAFGVAVGMIAQQLAGKAIRDAFFLTNFDAEVLPQAMTVAGLISVGMVFASSALYRRFAPQVVVPMIFALSAGVFGVVFALSAVAPRPAAVLLFLHTSSVGAVAISGFWSVVNESFDPHTLKRSVGRIASGASAGGVLGGLLTWQGAEVLSLEKMILVLIIVNLACAFGVGALGWGADGQEERGGPSQGPPVAALEVFEATPYLRHVLGIVVLLAVAAAAYDYAFKAQAAASLEGSEALVRFFSAFYAGVGVVTFLVQSLLSSSVLRRVGLTGAVSSLPAAIIAFGALALSQGSLWAYAAMRGAAAVAESSLYRSDYELLFTPLTPEKKRPTKSLIDVGGDKLGVSLGSALALFVVGLVPNLARPVLLAVAIACAGGALVYARRLYRGYLASLTDALERGAVRSDEVDTADAGMARAVERTVALQRTSEVARPSRREPVRRPETEPQALASGEEEAFALPEAVRPWAQASTYDLAALAALESADPTAHRWALFRHAPLPAHLVPPALDLLGHPRHGHLAEKALRTVAAAHLGQLGDAVLDRTRPMRVRSRLISVLAELPDTRAAEVLVHALASRPAEIRLRAAFGLSAQSRILSGHVDPERVYARIRSELQRHPPRSVSLGRRRLVLATVLQLLSLVTPAATLGLAVRAVSEGAGRARGTGREYLENVVPPDVLEGLLVLLRVPDASRVFSASGPEVIMGTVEAVDSLQRLRARLESWHPAWSPEA